MFTCCCCRFLSCRFSFNRFIIDFNIINVRIIFGIFFFIIIFIFFTFSSFCWWWTSWTLCKTQHKKKGEKTKNTHVFPRMRERMIKIAARVRNSVFIRFFSCKHVIHHSAHLRWNYHWYFLFRLSHCCSVKNEKVSDLKIKR